MRRFRPIFVSALLPILVALAPAARASDDDHSGGAARHEQGRNSGQEYEDHHERRSRETMRGAVQRGEIKPLEEVLAAVRAASPGEVVDVELEQEDTGAWIYEVRIVSASGRLVEVQVDAKSGTIVGQKDK